MVCSESKNEQENIIIDVLAKESKISIDASTGNLILADTNSSHVLEFKKK